MTTVIAALGPDDADAAAAFLQKAYVQTYVGHHGMTVEMFRNDEFRPRTAAALRERLARDDVVLLAAHESGPHLLATIGLRPDADDPHLGEIWGFYVDAAHQRRGLGRALWAALMADPRTQSYRQLYLHVVVGLDDAIAFYQRRGFTDDGVEGSWEWPSPERAVRTRFVTMRR